jgi:hypothetical protein
VLSLTDVAMPPPPNISTNSAELPNTVSQTKVSSEGTSMTYRTNSRIVRPREIRAMKVPTNGAHEIHQPQ